MDRNTITGVLLIGLILIGAMFFMQKNKSDEPKKPATTVQTDSVAVSADTAAAVIDTASHSGQAVNNDAAANLPAEWKAYAQGQDKEIQIENKHLLVKISSRGGRVSYVQLKDYKTSDGKPVVLTDAQSSEYGYEFFIGGYSINTSDLYFTPTQVSANAVTMTLSLPGGRSIQQHYALKDESYLVDNQLVLNKMNELIPRKNQYLNLHWQADIHQHEKDSQITYRNTGIYYRNVDESPDDLGESKEEEEQVKQELDWVSFKQQFFCQTIITKTPFSNAELKTKNLKNGKYIKRLEADITVPYSHAAQQVYNMQFYYGPLKYSTLKDMGLELERQIPLGWGFFITSWVNRFVIIPVFNLLNNYIANYGIIILILTILIKMIVLPLTYRSYLTTAKMKILKPELDELKAKYGDDMAKMQSEQMRLYRRAGVSPLGGCLPLLLQFPILIAMFRFFPSSIELRQQSFLWAHDLSTYDSIATLPFTIPYYGSHVSLWTLLMTISTLIYTRINNNLSPQQNEFKWLSYIMPIMFLGFFNNYSAGLSMYYFFFNVLTFGQQYIFKLVINDKRLKAQIEENKKKPQAAAASKGSSFQKRLEELSRRQQDMARQKQQRGGGGRKR